MARKKTKDRYRVESGKTYIDIRLKNPLQLFDSRDPAPFRERELDEKAVQYLVAAAEDIPYKRPFKIAFHFSESAERGLLESETIAVAVHNHFDYEVDLLRMQLKRTRKRGLVFMLIGLALLVVGLSLSQIVKPLPNFFMKPVLYEGLIIGSWVAIWRPIDLFLFDWWPTMEKMKYFKKLAATEVLTFFSPAGLPLSKDTD